MKESKAKTVFQNLLSHADVRINGDRAWDIRVHTSRLYERILSGGSLALGESYMDGWWDCDALDQCIAKILDARLDHKVKQNVLFIFWLRMKDALLNAQNRSRAFIIGQRHYDLGNSLFSTMLDKGLNYSCGYWEKAHTLDEAQEAKLDLICRKLGLQSGMTVLDIGSGWGGFANYAAEKYGVRVHGITVSKEQVKFAEEFCCGLDVTFELMDYRDMRNTFDRIVSIGMFEHVGCKNYRTFMNVVNRCLAPHGLFLLHTIARNISVSSTDPWTNKYIFPNSMLPSAKQITTAAEGIFILEHWHSFGQYYDDTLMAWYDNFTSNWDALKEDYDERFFRMWSYYLLSSAGGFRARKNQLWQIVFSKSGVRGGYCF